MQQGNAFGLQSHEKSAEWNIHDLAEEAVMVTVRRSAACAALSSLLIISGCAGVSVPSGPATGGAGVEGQWTDAQGVALSTFSGGQFVSVATDTGNRLSEGTYRYRDRQNIEISMMSLIRQRQSLVNCAMVTASQLNCTNDQGQNFILRRTS
jgi:hypothetical protein